MYGIYAFISGVGLEASKYIKAGQLVPDDVMIKFIVSEIKNVKNPAWLLDGNLLFNVDKLLVKIYLVSTLATLFLVKNTLKYEFF